MRRERNLRRLGVLLEVVRNDASAAVRSARGAARRLLAATHLPRVMTRTAVEMLVGTLRDDHVLATNKTRSVAPWAYGFIGHAGRCRPRHEGGDAVE